MKKSIFLLIAIFTATIFSSVHAQTVKHLTTAEFKKEIWDYSANKEWKYLGDKPAIIDLFATWCPDKFLFYKLICLIFMDIFPLFSSLDNSSCFFRFFNIRTVSAV